MIHGALRQETRTAGEIRMYFKEKPESLLRYIEAGMVSATEGVHPKSVLAWHIFQLAQMVEVAPVVSTVSSGYVPCGFISPYRVENIDEIVIKARRMVEIRREKRKYRESIPQPHSGSFGMRF